MLPELPPALTPRLTLRLLHARDARDLLSVVSASRGELGRYMSWPREMLTVEQAKRFIAIGREGWETERTVRLGIFERSGDSLIGSIELDGIDLRRSQAELGYWIRSDRTHRGLATEAARWMLHYGYDMVGLHKIRADVAVGNASSARVLQKIGFRLEGTLREDRPVGGSFVDHWRYGMLRNEWVYSAAQSSQPFATDRSAMRR